MGEPVVEDMVATTHRLLKAKTKMAKRMVWDIPSVALTVTMMMKRKGYKKLLKWMRQSARNALPKLRPNFILRHLKDPDFILCPMEVRPSRSQMDGEFVWT